MNWFTPDAGVIIALAGLAIAILANAAANFYRSPNDQIKDVNDRLTAQAVRMNEFERTFNTFLLKYTESFTKHDGAIGHLTEAMEDLTSEIKKLQGMVVSQTRTTRARAR